MNKNTDNEDQKVMEGDTIVLDHIVLQMAKEILEKYKDAFEELKYQ